MLNYFADTSERSGNWIWSGVLRIQVHNFSAVVPFLREKNNSLFPMRGPSGEKNFTTLPGLQPNLEMTKKCDYIWELRTGILMRCVKCNFCRYVHFQPLLGKTTDWKYPQAIIHFPMRACVCCKFYKIHEVKYLNTNTSLFGSVFTVVECSSLLAYICILSFTKQPR